MRLRFDPIDLHGLADEGYGARRGQWSFVVSRIGDGWAASWANHDPQTIPLHGRRLTTWIGEPGEYPSREAAEAACEETYDALRRAA